ncbi:MAG: DUF2298 domain-containing protein [Anaerolineaceae bacterium]
MEAKDKENVKTIRKRFDWKSLLIVVLLLAIICAGSYLRTVGVDWDEGRHLHPDERFLSMVLNNISPVQNVGEYFNTDTSTLNPGNQGYDFFVYGTLPLFIIRYVGEWVGQVGYDPITLVGRQLSALADILTILLVFLIAYRLYRWQIGLLAAALYAFAVLPIQQSHFMTVDTFTNTFGMLTVYAGVLIAIRPKPPTPGAGETRIKLKFADWFPYVLFGIALGMASASKINAASLALLLPIIELVRYYQLPQAERQDYSRVSLRMILLAAFVTILVFRIGQPYAFNGPGFISLGINQEWLSGLQSLRAQSAGQVDFPPALQWARRPATFSIDNLVKWGLGIPMGITAILSFIGMGWKIFKRKERKHLPLWAWTGFYFVWQAFAWVKAMRYLLLIYPLLAILVAWGIYTLWETRGELRLWRLRISPKFIRCFAVVLALVVLVGSASWAYAFTRIYTRPQTRVAATDWIYENIPGPVNFVLETADGSFTQQAPYRSGDSLTGNQVYQISFTSETSGNLTSFTLPSATFVNGSADLTSFSVTIQRAGSLETPMSLPVMAQNTISAEGALQPSILYFPFDPPISLEKGQTYTINLSQSDPNGQVLLDGVPKLEITNAEGETITQMLLKIVETVTPTHSYSMKIDIIQAGEIEAVELPYVLDLSQSLGEKTLRITLYPSAEVDPTPVSGSVKGSFTDFGDGKGTSLTIQLDKPLKLSTPQTIDLSLELVEGEGALAISSVAPVHESSWDDALPVSKDGYIPYSDGGGIFRGDLNLELYWTDDQAKRDRFLEILQQGDYIFISSNRQWGTTTRVPERYPLTSQYYRSLLGCPDELDLVTCYNTAEPGMFSGSLGFELVKTETSYPNLGSLSFNDQFAEEAFSVYDHPKVLIFKKSADFDIEQVRQILNAVDLTQVVNITAKQADSYDPEISSGDGLMLSEEELEVQRNNGTWSELFDRFSAINTNQTLAVLVFYMFSFILGLIMFPVVRMAFPGLYDKGYPFSRLAGFLLLAYLSFLLGSAGVPVTRTLVAVVFLVIAAIGITFGIIQRKQLLADLRQNWKHYLVIEGLALAAFLFFLWIRYQNPDLWHPWKGGEKPMDFSYLNAVIKSTTFPAYDPWFAGGYINYYYYGFVIIGIPIKLLGIVPSVAYNIVLPLWYSMLVIGAYSIGWNLTRKITDHSESGDAKPKVRVFGKPFWAGLSTSALLAFLGNQGTVKLLVQTLCTMGAMGQTIEGSTLFQQIGWVFKGFGMYLNKVPLPLYPGDWYWYPSRVIPGDPITEFPFFTFLYADLHAHLIAMPLVVFAVAWGMSALFAKGKWGDSDKHRWLPFAVSMVIGSLCIGALKPTNTWDYYTFLTLNIFILGYVGWKYLKPAKFIKKPWLARIVPAGILIALLFALSSLMYRPFTTLFHPGYSQIGIWTGDRTPLSSYFTHWGLLIFLILFWYAWETYRWLAVTPLSALKKLEPHKKLLTIVGIVLLALLIGLLIGKVVVAIVVVPLCLWSLILILRPDQSDAKRLAFFMIATGLLLTLVVELVYLVGDIGRMNVVFKLYLQAWLLMTLALGTGLITLWNDQIKWTLRTQLLFQIPLILLVAGALLFPMLGTADKIQDRMNASAPKTLDGMAYMDGASMYDMGVTIDLSEDYYAIQWMQDNIQGSPVILEAQAYEYRWGNRYTIYTGLPGVVGWNYHQRQQRAILRTDVVQQRVDQVNQFYLTEDLTYAQSFLEKYQVSYIVVGQLEQAFYPGAGLTKFEAQKGILWDEVYRYGSTVIYKVR